MAQRTPDTYWVDPDDPRAPPQDEWDRMTEAERDEVIEMLPVRVSFELMPPEGDPHWKAKVDARQTLDAFFRRTGQKVYVSSELAVYYPGEPRIVPDVFAVLDVETRERTKWVVASEGKGLDWVLEVHYAGDIAKDEAKIERYAHLGIAEYFLFDRSGMSLRGFRLPPAGEGRRRAGVYLPILPQEGRFASQVLGLDLMVDGLKLRFFMGTAPLPEAEELIAKLGSMLDDVIAHKQEAEALAKAEAKRAKAEAERAADLERQLAELRAEMAKRTPGG